MVLKMLTFFCKAGQLTSDLSRGIIELTPDTSSSKPLFRTSRSANPHFCEKYYYINYTMCFLSKFLKIFKNLERIFILFFAMDNY